MKDVYLVATALTDYNDAIQAAGILVVVRQGTDETTIGLEAVALLPTTNIRKVESIAVQPIDDITLRAIALIALAKGLL